MGIPYKILVALVLLGGAFVSGYYTRSPNTVVETKLEIKEVEKVITKRITEKETKPDGTVKETTTENISEVTTKKSDEKKVAQIVPQEAQYIIGVQWGLSRDMDYVPDQVQVGRRVIGSIFGTAGYSLQHKQVLVGIQVEF